MSIYRAIPSRFYLDTDHPVFQTPAPEYIDSLEDILAENIHDRWKLVQRITQQAALVIVREEVRKLYGIGRRETVEPKSQQIVALLAYVVDSATPLAELDAVLYCFGMLGRGEESMDEIAKRHGITRQAFSKKVERTSHQFGVAPRGGMRPVEQKGIYKDVHVARVQSIHRFAPAKP